MKAFRLFLFFLLGPWATAQAFVPGADYVLKKWVGRIGSLNSLHVQQTVTVYDREFPGGKAVVEEEIWLKKPFQMRRTRIYPRGEVHFFLNAKEAIRVDAGKKKVVAPLDVMGPVGALYAFEREGRLASFLRQAGLKTEETHLQLREQEVLLRIGSRDGAFLLMTREPWLPVGAKVEGRTYRFFSLPTSRFGTPYPERIEISEGKKGLERIEVKSVEVNKRISSRVFDPKPLLTPAR